VSESDRAREKEKERESERESELEKGIDMWYVHTHTHTCSGHTFANFVHTRILYDHSLRCGRGNVLWEVVGEGMYCDRSVCVRACMRARACVCVRVCLCVRRRACVCARARAPRPDDIARARETLTRED
jgi:hypothetical protein